MGVVAVSDFIDWALEVNVKLSAIWGCRHQDLYAVAGAAGNQLSIGLDAGVEVFDFYREHGSYSGGVA